MPFYEYLCVQCGRFEKRRSMNEASEPLECPTCQGMAQRVLSAPFLATMEKGRRIAHERNERSAHEPRVVKRKASGHSHVHHHGHQHCTTGRPWMIGH